MSRTARSIRTELSRANRHYLAMKSLQDQEARIFRFDPKLTNRITWVRNDIVELQAKLKKEVNHTA